MPHQENQNPSLRKIFKQAINLLITTPALLIPFVTFAIIESFALAIIFLAPRKPFLAVLGPPIITIWGERYMHYPFNFLLLPKLVAFSRMGLSVVFASILTGMVVVMIIEKYNKKVVNLSKSFLAALKQYIFLFAIVFVFTVLLYVLIRTLNAALIDYFYENHHKFLFLNPSAWLGPFLMSVDFFVAMCIQGAFIYSIPVLLTENGSFLKAIFKSFLLFKKYFIVTILLVGLPMLFYLPIMVLNYNGIFVIQRFFPELMLIAALFGIIISSLIIDPIITVSATVLYLETKNCKIS